MRNKSSENGSKSCVAFRNAMRNGIAIENPSSNGLCSFDHTPIFHPIFSHANLLKRPRIILNLKIEDAAGRLRGRFPSQNCRV